MKRIEKVGNLTIFAEYHEYLGTTTVIRIYNGADEVYSEAVEGHWDEKNGITGVINSVMMSLDFLTLETIFHFCPVVRREYDNVDGLLLSGEMEDGKKAYFLKVDDTRFYKHYNECPKLYADLIAK